MLFVSRPNGKVGGFSSRGQVKRENLTLGEGRSLTMTRGNPLFFILAISPMLIMWAVLPGINSPTGQAGSSLFPIIENGKYGYIDRSGRMVIKPQFERAKRFSEGLARVKVGQKWGFIDRAGRIVIQPQYELDGDTHEDHESLDFHEGMAAVSLSAGKKWGYIDRSGTVVVAPKYDHAYEFSEGIALVSNDYSIVKGEETLYMIGGHAWNIDKTGKVLNFPRVTRDWFSEGLAIIDDGANRERKMGYMDASGRSVIEPQFSVARSFRDGLAGVRPTNLNSWGYIDKTGRMVIPPRYVESMKGPGDFSEGLAAFATNDYSDERREKGLASGMWGFIDKSGSFVIQPQFEVVGRFSEGLAGACVMDETLNSGEGALVCGYIDKRGKWAIKLKLNYFVMTDFEDGLAFICNQSGCAYIDRGGNYVWQTSEPIDVLHMIGDRNLMEAY